MSMWTYVNGNILINTYSHTETEQSIQTFLDSLPKTSGSERPCEYHVSILDGYNVSGYKDGKTFEYQTQYSVSIVGTLRDTTVENLKKELMTILSEINKKFHIESNNFEDEELSIFANDLRRLPELFSEKEIYEQIPSLCFKIQFDSIIPARKMLLKAFDEYPSGVGTVYKEKVQEFIYRWQNIVYILIKISRRLSQQSLNTLNESVLSLLEDEKRFFKSVMEEN